MELVLWALSGVEPPDVAPASTPSLGTHFGSEEQNFQALEGEEMGSSPELGGPGPAGAFCGSRSWLLTALDSGVQVPQAAQGVEHRCHFCTATQPDPPHPWETPA